MNETPTAPDVYRTEGMCVVQGLVPPLLVNFPLNYVNVLGDSGRMSLDTQVPDSASVYGDPAFDTLMASMAEPLSKLLGIALLPTYSFVRVYRPGDELPPHVDREACEHSISIHLGASSEDSWPLVVTSLTGSTIPVDLRPGDGVMYLGRELRHWRQPCTVEWYAQAFLHFVDANGPFADFALDRRVALGAPRDTDEVGTNAG